MRVTIFGATGLLGKALVREWKSDEVVGLNSKDADIRDPQQVLAASRLRAVKVPMRAGNARERAECALTTHFDARHGIFLCIIRANCQFLRMVAFRSAKDAPS